MWHSFSEKACSGFPAVSFYKLTIRTQPIWKLRAAYFTVGLTASQRHPNVIDGNTKLKSLLRGAPAVLHLFAWSRFSNVAGLPHTILWERKHLVSNDYSTKVGSLLSPSLVKFQCLYPLLGFVWILWIFLMNLFLTLLYKKKYKAFASRNQKTVIAHFFWLTHLVCKWQLLPPQEIFSIK